MMQPYVVNRLFSGSDEMLYEATPAVWLKPLAEETARELRQMMIRTVVDGTAHKGFRHIYRDRILSKLDIGGKTGSLTGKHPKGWTEWFVGYASSAEQKIAIGVVLVSEDKWRIRPSELSKEIFRYYFSPRPILEANAARNTTYGP
jgi:cell division protein FtsI/penicillin-binding protein 2